MAHKKETPHKILSSSLYHYFNHVNHLRMTAQVSLNSPTPAMCKEANNDKTHKEPVEFPRKEERSKRERVKYLDTRFFFFNCQLFIQAQNR